MRENILSILIIYILHKFLCKKKTTVLKNLTALFTQNLKFYLIRRISSIIGIHKFNN
jgi:hypothetical protein